MRINEKKYIYYVLLIVSFLVQILGQSFSSVALATFSILIISISIIVYSLIILRKRMLLLLYVAVFNIFIMGGFYINVFKKQYWGSIKGTMIDYSFSKTSLLFSFLIIYISLVSLLIGACLSEKVKIRISKTKKILNTTQQYKYVVRKVSKYLYYLFSIGGIFNVLYKIYMVFTNSYLYLYTNYVDIPLLSIMFIMSNTVFCIFLSTFPSKKELKYPSFIYILTAILNIFTGSRSMTITSLMIIILYYYIRDKNSNEIKKNNFIKKKTYYILIACIPLVFILMSVVSTLRSNVNNSRSIFDMLILFISGQGETGYLIPATIDNTNYFPNGNTNYTFGIIINFIKENQIMSSLFNLESDVVKSILDRALFGNTFSSTISYMLMPTLYMRGMGLGGCYIAEIWLDFGISGVIISSIIIGMLIIKINNINTSNLWGSSILLLMCSYILTLPRTNLLYFLQKFLSNANIISYIGVILISQVLYKIGSSKVRKVKE